MDEIIKRYIDRVLRLREERSEIPLDRADLEDIARELGLTEADLAAVRDEVADHRVRARGFLRHDLVSEAVVELEEAAAMAPTDLDVQIELALALIARDQDEDRERARNLAIGVLEADPDREEAFAIVAQARKPARRSFAPEPPDDSLPVQFDEAHPFAFLVWKSEHSVYSDAAYYGLTGWLRNDSDSEIVSLRCDILLRGDGKEWVHEGAYFFTATGSPLRPGQTHPMTSTIAAPMWRVESVVLRPSELRTEAVVGSAGPSRELELGWKSAKPRGVDLRVHERSTSFEPTGGRHRIGLEFANVGAQALDVLKVDVVYFDLQDTVICIQDQWVQSSGFPPFLPGEIRVNDEWSQLKAAPARYEILVREIVTRPG